MVARLVATSPPFIAGQSAPFPVLILWVVNPKGISRSAADTHPAKRNNYRGPQSWIAGRAFTVSLLDQTPRSWRKNCGALPTWGSEEGKSSKEGDEILGISNGGFALADTRRVHRRRLLVGTPSDWEGKHSRNFRPCRPGEPYPISDYNELFVWNQACHRQPARFHLIGAESHIGRRTPSALQSDGWWYSGQADE